MMTENLDTLMTQYNQVTGVAEKLYTALEAILSDLKAGQTIRPDESDFIRELETLLKETKDELP